jgi:hypothetical protein
MTSRPTRSTMSIHAGTALLLGVALIVTTLPARADDDLPIDRKIFRGVMEGLGLRDSDKPDINYQERPPLVIPPSRNLPAPENATASANNPAWPVDVEVQRKKRQAAIDAKRNISDEREREQNPLRPDQLTPGGTPRGIPTSSGVPNSATAGDRLNAQELNQKRSIWSSMFGKRDDEVIKFTQEPKRTELTDPPPGYQTPSPDQPYGLSQQTTTYKPKATDYTETHGTIEGRERGP